MNRLIVGLLCVGGMALPARAKITFDFDYRFDVNSFFNPNTANGQAARASLNAAAQAYQDRIVESNLSAIVPPNAGSWTAKFVNPGTGSATAELVNDLNIGANVIKVFVGGRALNGAIGSGGPGGVDIQSTNVNFQNTVVYRGQTAAKLTLPSDDFGPWGGVIAFDNTVAWSFDLNAPAEGKNDFLTAATHELAHVLGFGLAPSWKTRESETLTPFGVKQYVGPFTGTKAKASFGGPVPLEPVPVQQASNDRVVNAAHIDYGTMSSVGGLVPQEAIMDPDITIGTRKQLTLLDWAVLDDIGWDLARPGDANADGTVDFNDLVPLAQNYNVTDGHRRWSDGDFNYDGKVDFNDLVFIAQNYNTTGVLGSDVPAAAAGGDFNADWQTAQAAAGVPEPTGVVLLAVPAVWFLRRRRRR